MEKELTRKHTVLPTIALRGLTVFPNVLVHFDVGREASIKALEEAMATGQPVFLTSQKDIAVEKPSQDDLNTIGTISNVRQLLRMPGDNVRVMVEGVTRARLLTLTRKKPYLEAEVEEIPAEEHARTSAKAEALIRNTYDAFQRYTELAPKNSQDLIINVLASEDPGYIADYIAQNIFMRNNDKQTILEELRPVRRLERMYHMLCREIDILTLDLEIQNKAREQMADNQRDYYLREQMRAIQQELGEGDTDTEVGEYRKKISEADLPDTVREKLQKELGRLAKQPFGSSESSVLRNYLDVCLELPWNKKTKERVSVDAVRKALNKDHFGLDKVKERILEFVAVKQLAPELKGQVICLVGPPGVGKTSIAMSIAGAMNRKLARISLGGVSDEAEIRGHRKTYVGSMPGRIIAAINQAGSSNPLLLLDEIDKMGSDYRGAPSAALLEVLAAEQPHTYRDHYLEIPYDLSDVLFITTANTLDTIPRPLLDRMEIIELGSYTDEEKLMIAKNHLIPKQLNKHGLKKSQLRITDDAIREIITCYTRESGVRNLERSFGEICRKAAMQIVAQETPKRITVNGSNLDRFLGVRKFLPDRLPCMDQVGLVTGLAWTSVGGETLEVEVNVMDGSGKLELTGNLGDVMKESAHAAMSYIRANAQKLGIAPDFYKTKDIHVHFPEGAVPKDGPSAGVTVCTAIVSALTGTTVRRDVAMTGEISLRGRVMRIGGLKEKTMAALRHGIRTVIIPSDNERDLEEIDQTVRRQLNFISAQTIDTVLDAALNRTEERNPTLIGDISGDMKSKVQKPELRQ